MILKTGETAVYEFWFENSSGEGVSGLTVTADVYNPAGAKVVTDGAATEIGGGLYRYSYTASSAGVWNSVGKTTSTAVAAKHRPSVYAVGVAGVNNLDASISSIATAIAGVAAAVWGYVTRTLTSSSGGATAAEVWAYASRTLTQSAQQVISAVSGTTISVARGDTWKIPLTVGSLAGRTKLWVTVKREADDADSESIFQAEETAGLLYLNGAPATAGQGSVTVTNETTGAIAIGLLPVASNTLAAGRYRIGITAILSGDRTTKTEGIFKITDTTTRAIS